VRFTAGVNDRYLFFLAPLFFCGAVAFLLERRPWLVPLGLGGAAAVGLVASATLAQRGPSLVSPAAAFHDVLDKSGVGGVPTTAAVIGVLATVAVGVVRVVDADRRRQALYASGAVLLFLGIETLYLVQKIVDGQHPSADYLAGRNWVDRKLPDGKRAAVLLSNFGDRFGSAATWWDLTFWNVHADRALRFFSGDDFIQKTTFPLDVDAETGALSGVGTDYLVLADAEPRLALAGATTLDARYGMHLVRLPADPHVSWALVGTDAGGHLAAASRATLSLYGPPARPGDVVLRLSAKNLTRGYRVHVARRWIRVPKGATRTVHVRTERLGRRGPVTVPVSVAGKAPTDPALEPGPQVTVVRVPGG
jgi:hypothetical protein